MENKKVSLILTTYNSKEHLTITLDSIEKQDYQCIEVIIKDGGSSDGTLDVIKQYKDDSKYNVIYKVCSDKGIYDAMNQGYELTSGNLILFFNDVFTRDDAISLMVKSIEENPECAGCHSDLVYERDGKIIRNWHMGPQKTVCKGWMPGHPTLMLKREIYEKYGLYKTDYKVSADYEFMIRFIDKCYISYIPQVLISMFYGGTSNKGIKSYIISLTEGNRALKENGYHFYRIISIIRTIRVLLQFVS